MPHPTTTPQRPVISLFTGAMGLDLGLARAGLTPAIGQELDPHAAETIRANGHRVVEGDIRALLHHDPRLTSLREHAPEPFAVVGGPPCQSYSTAGRRGGLDDPRGSLVLDFVAAISLLRPRFAVMENVANLARFRGPEGRPLPIEIADLLAGLGYATTAGVVDAADYGAAQSRRRFVLLASRDGAAPGFPPPTRSRDGAGGLPAWRTVREAWAGLDPDDPGSCAEFSPRMRRFIALVPEGGNWRDLPAELREEAMGGAYRGAGGRTGYYRRLHRDRHAPTLVTSPTQRATTLAHPTRTRPLSVREYARLQGFPDGWRLAGPLSAKYRQLGNAVPVELGEALGRALLAADAG